MGTEPVQWREATSSQRQRLRPHGHQGRPVVLKLLTSLYASSGSTVVRFSFSIKTVSTCFSIYIFSFKAWVYKPDVYKKDGLNSLNYTLRSIRETRLFTWIKTDISYDKTFGGFVKDNPNEKANKLL